jgi:hypothetical protein
MNGKGYDRKRWRTNERYYAGISLEELIKTMNTSISIASRRGRDSSPEPPEYDVGVLTTWQRRSKASNKMISDWLTRKDVEGSGQDLIEGTIQGRGVHVTGVSAAYTFKLNKNILSE